jgi:hypothetical protein
MKTALRISGFVAALAGTFGIAYGVGGLVDPLSDPEPAAHAEHRSDAGSHGDHKGTAQSPAGDAVGGLRVADGGYTLELKTSRLKAERSTELRFDILDAAGRPLTAYQRVHGKELHLVLASRDLSVYRHLHPTRAADGTWSTTLALPSAGDYRVFADFTPRAKDATNLTLGADLAVSGRYAPEELPEESRTDKVQGYTVNLDGRLDPGSAQRLTLKVSKNGRPVTDLEPYLGAYGHLVALRSGDLAYLHVHPEGEPGQKGTKSGPTVPFLTTAPSSSTYRLFFDFQHNGKVRTADFTLVADAAQGGETKDETKERKKGGHADDGHAH